MNYRLILHILGNPSLVFKMLLENSSSPCHKFGPLVCVSRAFRRYRYHHSTLLRFPSSQNFKTEFSLLHLAHPRRKARECCCKITDEYYEEMLEANPGSLPLLRNYAKHLHDVKGDISKAEEAYERAVVACPEDGEALSLYAQFIWETHKDGGKAQAYFDQATKAAPNDWESIVPILFSS